MQNNEESLCTLIRNLQQLEMDLLSPSWLQRNSESSRSRELLGQVKVAVDNVRNSIWCAQAVPELDRNDMADFIEQHRMHRAIELLRSRGRNVPELPSSGALMELRVSYTHI
jgi:hypothetical protein